MPIARCAAANSANTRWPPDESGACGSTLGAVKTVSLSPDDWPAALAATEGPQLVIAGPGTGKTEFLARRCAHLVALGVAPSSLAVLTFSRRAADRLTQRIQAHTDGTPPRGVTFHSLAYRILETFAPEHLEWDAMPTLLTGPEQVAVVRALLSTEPEADWSPTFRSILTTQTFAREVADFIMRSQEYLVDDEDLAARAASHPDWRGLPSFRRRYLDQLKSGRRIDYGTLQAQAVRVLAADGVADAIAHQFSHVLVDEYQDTTASQGLMIRLLASRHGNVTVAGDPAQSIYRFRGAEPGNILSFPEDFSQHGSVQTIVLTQSFRCPEQMLEAGRRLLGSAQSTYAGEIVPAPHQGSVEAYVFSQASEEAEWIAAEIQRMTLNDQIAASRVAVLVRTKRGLLNELSRALSRRGISHNTPDARLVDHPAVRLVFDLAFAAAHNGVEMDHPVAAEVDRAARRILLGPLFRLTLGAERQALRARLLTGAPWSTIIRDTFDDAAALADLIADATWATGQPAAAGFWHVWSSLPQFALVVADAERSDWRAALASFGQSVGRLYERDPERSLFEYRRLAESDDFEAEPLLTLRPADRNRVTLTTLHQAKGLEFDVVFIADAVEDVFPDLRRHRSLLQPRRLGAQWREDAATEATEQMREEIRLAYTATTRAARRVVWSATTAGFDLGNERPSRFLSLVAGTAELGGPLPDQDDRPLTYLEAEASLRRMAADPTGPAPSRLAAVDQLVRRPNPGVREASSFTTIRPRGPDTGLVTPPLRLSPSQAESYAACPRRYALERRLAVDADYGLYGTFGTMMHQVLELAERVALERGDPRSTRSDAGRALEAAFASYELGVGERRAAWRRRGQALIDALYDDWIRPDARARLLEHPLSLNIAGVEWIGRADRIEEEDGRVRIVDYKTKTSPVTKDEAGASLQLGFYLLAAREDPQVLQFGEPVEAEMWFPLARAGPTYRPLDVTRLPEIREKLDAIASGIASENWEPRVSPDCERCSVRQVCPAFPEGREAFVR